MNFIYPNDLTENKTSKVLCITNDGDLGTIDISLLLTGIRPVVGEVVWFPFELLDTVKEYKKVDGGLFSIDEYPEAAAVLDGIYNLGNEPDGYMRLPNMENGQLFSRQCGNNLSLGTISFDTFKSHTHAYRYRTDNEPHTCTGEQNIGMTHGVETETNFSTPGRFNETAMKNVVMIGYLRMLP